jgi:tetratricopeptide (TPR) repeat protein
MPMIVIRLADILTSPSDPIDLTALPSDKAEARMRRICHFLPEDARVSVDDDVATIDIPEESAQRAGRAMETHEGAVKLASRGRYQSAIKLLAGVLDVLPNHLDARRNLAMAYMELGDNQATRRHLFQVLQLNPQDAQALQIMGNLYAQAEGDLDTAAWFYEAAYRVGPKYAYIFTNYGGLEAKRGDYDVARDTRAVHRDRAGPSQTVVQSCADARRDERCSHDGGSTTGQPGCIKLRRK